MPSMYFLSGTSGMSKQILAILTGEVEERERERQRERDRQTERGRQSERELS